MRRIEETDHYAGPSISEAQLRARVVELAHAAGWRVYSVPMSNTPRSWVKNAVGYPDLTLARHKEVLWIELKDDRGIISDAQRAWLDALPWAYVVRPSDLHNGSLARLLVGAPVRAESSGSGRVSKSTTPSPVQRP